MLPSQQKTRLSIDEDIKTLQDEISSLEKALIQVKNQLGDFEKIIHRKLDQEISRLHELNQIYKKHKRDKKLKRLEQKQRGKNYIAPTHLQTTDQKQIPKSNLDVEEQRELRRLYKEAIVQVHPDKIAHAGEKDNINRATDLTAQLNHIYKSGDLEELLNFYQYIILGNSYDNQEINIPQVDGKLRLAHLIKKKETLARQLSELKASYTYNILTTYENPLTFIDELYHQLHGRIKLMEKRTKKAK